MSFIEINQNIYQKHYYKTVVIVACFCAEWCSTCKKYKINYSQLDKIFPKITFLWIDIDDNSNLAEFYTIENFPTILIEDVEGVRFFGVIKNKIGILNTIITHHVNLPILPVPQLKNIL